MYLIAGLGNPGGTYKWTRHNAGFEVAAKLAYDHGIDMATRKFRGITGKGVIAGQKVMLAMPQTFMNLSGECVRDLLGYFGVPPERFIAVYDDVAIALGDVRVRGQGSAGGHNGMKNIIFHLETDVFPRVRVGVGATPPGWEMMDFVLSRFRDDEREAAIQGMTAAAKAVEVIISEGTEAAMRQFNKKQQNDEPKKPDKDDQ